MAFGNFDSRRHQGPMAEINVVPLVDVMLVLLVEINPLIFLHLLVNLFLNLNNKNKKNLLQEK